MKQDVIQNQRYREAWSRNNEDLANEIKRDIMTKPNTS